MSDPRFYSMISDPTDEIMLAEIFLLNEEKFTNQSEEGMFFRSNFNINRSVHFVRKE